MKTAITRGLVWAILVSVGLGGATLPGQGIGADEPRCAGSGIAVPQWADGERSQVCAAAEAAISFLRDAGFRFQNESGLTIRPLQKQIAQFHGREFGHFDVQRNEIVILPLATAMQTMAHASAFEVHLSPALWASYVSHEVAHAVAEQHFAPGVRRFTASEYIAAVVQLVTMEPATRDSILARLPDLAPYRSADEISSLYYLMAPGHFAIKVYHHYMDLGDAGPEFMRRLLSKGLNK